MRHRKNLIILTVILLTSCSLNKVFLLPTKITETAKRITMINPATNDTTVVFFSGDNYQPTFTKSGKDTIDFDFTIESVVFKSANGNKINGWFLKPKNKTSTITLLHLHGNSGCLFSQFQAITPLIKNDFQIFLFDYSGFGFSEGKATKENILTDALSALDYLKNRQDIKNTKLVIYGQSLGGHLSAVVAAQRQNDIDGLVIEGAFSSHKDIAANNAGIFGRIFVNEKYSAVKTIKDYKKPLLVIHSTEDKIIPFKMGQKIFDNANSPKEFFEIKKEHIHGPKYYTDEISKKIKSMCTAN